MLGAPEKVAYNFKTLHRLAVCSISGHFGKSENSHSWLKILGLKIKVLKHKTSELEIYSIGSFFQKNINQVQM